MRSPGSGGCFGGPKNRSPTEQSPRMRRLERATEPAMIISRQQWPLVFRGSPTSLPPDCGLPRGRLRPAPERQTTPGRRLPVALPLCQDACHDSPALWRQELSAVISGCRRSEKNGRIPLIGIIEDLQQHRKIAIVLCSARCRCQARGRSAMPQPFRLAWRNSRPPWNRANKRYPEVASVSSFDNSSHGSGQLVAGNGALDARKIVR